MAVGFRVASATWTEITTDLATVAIPATPQAGDRMFLLVAWKDFARTLTVSGWTSCGTAFADGSTGSGNGTGSMKVEAFYRDWQSGDSDPALDWDSTTNLLARACILVMTKGSENWSTPLWNTAAWPVTSATQTVSASATTVVPSSGAVLAFIGLRDDSATFTRGATTGIDVASGITWNGNYAEQPPTHHSTTTGNDGAGDAGYRLVTTGGTVTLRVTATISATETGSVGWVTQGVDNNQLVTPSTASLTLSTFAPTVTTTNNQLVTPGAASLSLAAFTPNVMFPGATFTDDFERAALGANWTQRLGTPQIYGSSDLGAGSVGNNIARWAGTVIGDNQSSEVTIAAFADGDVGVAVRVNSAGSLSDYLLSTDGSNFELGKHVADTYSTLQTLGSPPSAGDTIKISVSGTTIKAFKNGSEVASVTDSDIASGQPGVTFFHASLTPTSRAESWVGADLVGSAIVLGTAALTLTTFAPTVAVSDNKSVVPGTASLVITSFAPAVLTPSLVVPGAASLALASFAAAVIIGISVVPATASLALTGFAPVVSTPVLVVPGTASLGLSTFAPTVSGSAGTVVTPGTATLALASFAPVVSTPTLVTPATATLALASFAPTVLTPRLSVPGTASLVLVTFAPTVLTPRLVVPGVAALTLTTFAPTVVGGAGLTLVPSAAALVLAGLAPTVSSTNHVLVTPATRALSLSGYAPSVSVSGPPPVVSTTSEDGGMSPFVIDRLNWYAPMFRRAGVRWPPRRP